MSLDFCSNSGTACCLACTSFRNFQTLVAKRNIRIHLTSCEHVQRFNRTECEPVLPDDSMRIPTPANTMRCPSMGIDPSQCWRGALSVTWHNLGQRIISLLTLDEIGKAYRSSRTCGTKHSRPPSHIWIRQILLDECLRKSARHGSRTMSQGKFQSEMELAECKNC